MEKEREDPLKCILGSSPKEWVKTSGVKGSRIPGVK